MSENTVGLCIYTVKPNKLVDRLVDSLKKNTDFPDYELILHYNDQSAHKNMKEAWEKYTNFRYFALLDEDIVFLEPNWLSELMINLTKHDKIGVMSCVEAKSHFTYGVWKQNRSSLQRMELEKYNWIPAYIMLFDRQRIKLDIDDNIPGKKGMTDVDICWQIRDQGLACVRTNRTLILHPEKPIDAETLSYYPAQFSYMRDKWNKEPYATELEKLFPSVEVQSGK